MPTDRNYRDDWNTLPGKPDDTRAWPIMRVGTKGVSRLVIVSNELIGRFTHYWKGRTQPCLTDVCEACANGQAARWYGWLAVISETSGAKAIVEITYQGYVSVADTITFADTLRGRGMAIRRIPAKPNGKMRVEIRPHKTVPIELPNEPDIRAILERMWQATPKEFADEPPPSAGTRQRSNGRA